jgi:hypothetical protein
LDVFLFLSSILLFFGSQPGKNSIGMGFYHQSMHVEFPRALDPPKGPHCAVQIGSETYDFVRVRTRQECTMLSSLSFPFLLYGYAAQKVYTYRGG